MLRRLIVNSVVVLLAVGLFSTVEPAATSDLPRPQVVERGADGGPFGYIDDDCGFRVRVRGTSHERFVTYSVPGSSGQAFLEHRRYAFRQTITNPATGASMVVSGRGSIREVEATHLQGDTWEVIAVESGTPFVVRNARDRTVLADDGILTTRSVQDTLGDGLPSSRELQRTVVDTFGRFPSLADDFDYCALVSRLTG